MMKRRKKYLRLVAAKRQTIEHARESFERTSWEDNEVDRSQDGDDVDVSLEASAEVDIPGMRTRSVPFASKAPDVVTFFKFYELKSRPLRIGAEAPSLKDARVDTNETSEPVEPPMACRQGITANSEECVSWRNENVGLPSYVINDYVQRCSEGSSLHDRWPEVIFSDDKKKQGSTLSACPYDMHQLLWFDEDDQNDALFHVALLDRQQKPFLYGDFSRTYAGDFSDVDVFHPDFDTYPLLRRATVSVTELRGGDVLFVPVRTLHRFFSSHGRLS